VFPAETVVRVTGADVTMAVTLSVVVLEAGAAVVLAARDVDEEDCCATTKGMSKRERREARSSIPLRVGSGKESRGG
jgi:hypothetical protein